LSVQLIFETDNVVVGSVLGVAAVASYQVALGPSSVIQALAQSANGVTLTTASALHGKAAAADQQRVFCETTRGAAIMALPVLVVFGSWGPQLLRAWVGGAYVTSSATLTVLAGGFTVISIQGSAAAILVAKDRYRLAGILAIAEAVANITLSVILAHVWGIVGVAAGTAIPTMLTTFLFYLPAAARVLELRLRVLAARLLGPLLINGAVAMVLDISGLRRERFPNLWLIVLADGVVFGVCVALAILLDSRERSAYLGLLRSWLPS
jgi:O-antigen/teichoic acid export membrane protein